jgi:hypothetical protein
MVIYYLMVKTHNVTGLKYLCQTKKTDPHKYLGSGKYWRLHLKVHGNDIHTDILRECISKTELRDWGIHYSNLWDVTKSNEWANLKDELGDGGQPKGFGLGRTLTEAHRESLKKAKTLMSEETIQKMIQSGKRSYEKTFALLTPEQKQEKYKNSLGKLTTEQRREIGKKNKNKGGDVWSKASSGQVTVTDITGLSKRIPQQLFNDMKNDMMIQNIPMSDWEFVQVSSLESKKRKNGN